MTEGRILPKLVKFLIPFIVVNFTQIFYNAIDAAILGNFSGDDSVAAVGATSAIIYLIAAFSIGLSNGVNIVVARCVGSKERERALQSTGTAIFSGFLFSLVVLAIVIPLAPTILRWMKCDPLVFDLSALYLRTVLCSIPIQWLYNFLAASVRASGNSSRPMIISLIAGGFKVLFNLLLVGALDLDVLGAGLSSILANLISLTLILILVRRARDTYYTLEWKNIRFRKDYLFNVIRFGLPSAMSSACYYIASAIIQSAVNSMGKATMTANAVSSQIDAFVYNAGAATAAATMAFVSQNIGAKKIDRAKRTVGVSCALATALSLSLGSLIALFADQLCGLITDSPEVIEIAKGRLLLFCFTYFLSANMDVLSSSLNAMGYSKNQLFVSSICGLILRPVWVRFIWPIFGGLRALYMAIPATCALCIVEYLIVFFFFALPSLNRRYPKEASPSHP